MSTACDLPSTLPLPERQIRMWNRSDAPTERGESIECRATEKYGHSSKPSSTCVRGEFTDERGSTIGVFVSKPIESSAASTCSDRSLPVVGSTRFQSHKRNVVSLVC